MNLNQTGPYAYFGVRSQCATALWKALDEQRPFSCVRTFKGIIMDTYFLALDHLRHPETREVWGAKYSTLLLSDITERMQRIGVSTLPGAIITAAKYSDALQIAAKIIAENAQVPA